MALFIFIEIILSALISPQSLNHVSLILQTGRVHRIGQEKPTFVHRFLIKSTVESKVFNLGRSRMSNQNQMVTGFGARVREDDVLGIDELDKLINDAQRVDETGTLFSLSRRLTCVIACRHVSTFSRILFQSMLLIMIFQINSQSPLFLSHSFPHSVKSQLILLHLCCH